MKDKVDYAIIAIGGLQYKVKEGDEILVNRLKREVGEEFTIDSVLFVKTDKESLFGRPLVEGCRVIAEVVEHTKGPKVVIFKMKAKKHYSKKLGHRQPLTKLKIKSIQLSDR